ncbi:MAG: hypothetical protein K2J62_07545 [Bacteroidales bacterium]|nr:hypothetical protein [Bacteroidales bacterium]
MKRHSIIFLLLFCLSSCMQSSDSPVPLNSVNVYYQPDAPWGQLRFETYGIDSLVSNASPHFIIGRRDSLDRIYCLCRKFHPDTSSYELYEDAVIVALLHYDGRTDTLATNARPGFRMNYNSCPLYDDDMVMCLIDAVVCRDSVWKESFDSLYYDGEFNYLSRSGMSPDQWLPD